MPNATLGLSLEPGSKEDFLRIQKETEQRQITDKIKFLEARGYRVVLNNSKDNRSRDDDMIRVLEANGYKVTK
jgi:hypothetical protein